MQMKNISIYSGFTELVRSYGFDAAARRAVDMGFTSVEFLEISKTIESSILPDRQTARKARKILSDNGLSVSCFSIAARLWQPNATPEKDAFQKQRLLLFAEIAAELDSPFLHHTIATAHDSTPYETVANVVFPRALQVIDRAAELGLTVLYEPQGMYFNGLDGFGKLYRSVKAERPSIGVCGDVGNPVFVEEDPVSFFREFAAEMRHIHLKDYHLHTEAGLPTKYGSFAKDSVIGNGDIDIPTCLSLLKKAGYNGAFAIEHTPECSMTPARQLLEQHFYA